MYSMWSYSRMAGFILQMLVMIEALPARSWGMQPGLALVQLHAGRIDPKEEQDLQISNSQSGEGNTVHVRLNGGFHHQVKQASVEMPTKPGCYVITATGCSRHVWQGPRAGVWMLDKAAGSRESFQACVVRRSAYNRWCQVNDSRMHFVPQVASEPSNKVVHGLAQQHLEPGCYVFTAVGCQPHRRGPKAGVWTKDPQAGSDSSAEACQSRLGQYNKWCNIVDAEMRFVAPEDAMVETANGGCMDCTSREEKTNLMSTDNGIDDWDALGSAFKQEGGADIQHLNVNAVASVSDMHTENEAQQHGLFGNIRGLFTGVAGNSHGSDQADSDEQQHARRAETNALFEEDAEDVNHPDDANLLTQGFAPAVSLATASASDAVVSMETPTGFDELDAIVEQAEESLGRRQKQYSELLKVKGM